MGDPKRIRKKFESPHHPWQKARIEEEKQLIKEYGLKNKSEVWKMRSKAKNFADQAKRLTPLEGNIQAEKEKKQILERLYRLGLLAKGSNVDDVLGIKVRDILDRRMQTIVFKKGFARSIKQARQFITHRHIAVGNKIITAPAYLVPLSEEGVVLFVQKSSLSNPEHPERAVEKERHAPKKQKKEKEKEEKEEHGKKEVKKEKKKAEKETKKEKQKQPKEEKKTKGKKEEKAETKKEEKEPKPEEKKK